MTFNAKKETKKIIKFIQDYYQKNNLGGVVLGISGGKDSGVVAGLFTKALGPENVIGITLPIAAILNNKLISIILPLQFFILIQSQFLFQRLNLIFDTFFHFYFFL